MTPMRITAVSETTDLFAFSLDGADWVEVEEVRHRK